ncbi:TetR/AcrR family transcriptional regulator [Ornithinibacillus californiensis]|uniref:TetR/AcrR family transcriptional regulator n=1 Tax=Ornithinibacillus californiensis TaxID=161536 RepID=UPI00069FE066|nr:TetR/AcrR family transcriptional regulator [Ornithinibacillus californiensis]
MNKRKWKIIDAAHRLFIEKGFHATSIQDILDEAEISKGTFYNYFTSKNECLLAIIEYVEAEGYQKRIELAIGKDQQDEEVFIKQLAVRLNMNKKYNMLALFNHVMQLDDKEIRKYMDKQYRAELNWVSKRIADVYTPGKNDYSLDHAVMLLGMVHHFLHVWKMGMEEEVEPEKVIRFILKRMKSMMNDQMKSGEKFFSEELFSFELSGEGRAQRLLDSFIKKIDYITKKADSEQLDYLHFLQKEITSESPRKFIIESMMLSLKHVFKDTELEYEISQVVQLAEKYIKCQEGEEV